MKTYLPGSMDRKQILEGSRNRNGLWKNELLRRARWDGANTCEAQRGYSLEWVQVKPSWSEMGQLEEKIEHQIMAPSRKYFVEFRASQEQSVFSTNTYTEEKTEKQETVHIARHDCLKHVIDRVKPWQSSEETIRNRVKSIPVTGYESLERGVGNARPSEATLGNIQKKLAVVGFDDMERGVDNVGPEEAIYQNNHSQNSVCGKHHWSQRTSATILILLVFFRFVVGRALYY